MSTSGPERHDRPEQQQAEIHVRASDRTLRTAAWVVTLSVPAMAALGVPIALAAPGSSVSAAVGDLSFLAVVITFPIVGLLIVLRKPRNRIGWVLEGIGLCIGVIGLADNYATFGLVVDPGAVPGAGYVAGALAGSWAPVIGLMGTFPILLFPDGRLPSPRWRPVAWMSAATIVVVTVTIAFMPGTLDEGALAGMPNPLGWEAGRPFLIVLLAVFLPLLPISIVACALALIFRFRRSHGTERLQLKWLAAAGGVMAGLYLATMAATWLLSTSVFTGAGPAWLSILQTITIVSFALLPAAMGVAILKHGLYGIDVVINRTLVYGSLTFTLAGVYIGSVLLLQLAIDPVTKQSDLAVAASTLVVAALFRPVRSRIQSGVDRRFYRSRYDAARTLDAFASRLRHEVDLDAVGADLRATVEQTVQPTHLSLWLRT